MSFYMNLSALVHLAFIGKIIYMLHPQAILTTEKENDFNTSLLSYYCEQHGVEYIGIMHGETYLSPLHAFVRFSRFYTWDEQYIEHYVITGSLREFFRVYATCRFRMNIPVYERKEFFITYYLQGQNEYQLRNICHILLYFTKHGKKCAVRMHPKVSDKILIHNLFDHTGIKIEENNIPIERSYALTDYIVSMYSTVLSEAYANGLTAIIDDITDKETYNNLHKVMYINLNRIHGRLSELLNKIEK